METKAFTHSKLFTQYGYSIIEVLISLFIVGMMLVLYSAASQSVVLNGNVRHQELAKDIAVTEMEDLRSAGYGALPASGAFTSPLLTTLPGGQASLTVNAYNANTKEVIVAVSWVEAGGSTTHTVTFDTLINQNGL